MANLNDLVPDVLAIVPKAPRTRIMKSLNRMLRDFCERSGYWRYTDTVAITAGNIRGYLETPDNAIPNMLVFCSESGVVLERDGHDFALVLASAKTHDLQIKYEITCVPERGSIAIEEGIYDLYGDEIAEGAAAHLLSTVGTEWMDPQLAQPLGARFEQAIIKARRSVKSGFDSRPKRLRPHPGNM